MVKFTPQTVSILKSLARQEHEVGSQTVAEAIEMMLDFNEHHFDLFELIVRCLPVIREAAQGLIESVSHLRVVETATLELVAPIPGSIPAEYLSEAEEALALVRDVEAVTGKHFIGPQWFDDMVLCGVGGRPQQGGA